MPPILQREGLSTMGQRGRIPAGLWRRILLLKGGVDLSGLTAYEDFEGYQLGEITKPFNSIPGWLGPSGPKSNFISRVATEDFEDYDAQDPLDSLLDGGDGWDGPLFTPLGTRVSPPLILPETSQVTEFPLEVNIVQREEGSTIFYTTDGSTPERQSTEFTAPFNIASASVTVKAFAIKEGRFDSKVVEQSWELASGTLNTPELIPGKDSSVTFPVTVAIRQDQNAPIFFTTDGTTPDANSTQYTGPISLADDTTILKAIAIKSGFTDSAVVTSNYSSGGVITTFSFDGTGSGALDKVGIFESFQSDNVVDYNFTLAINLGSETEIEYIEVRLNGDSDTNIRLIPPWATKARFTNKSTGRELIFTANALGVDDGNGLVHIKFVNTFGTFSAGAHNFTLFATAPAAPGEEPSFPFATNHWELTIFYADGTKDSAIVDVT